MDTSPALPSPALFRPEVLDRREPCGAIVLARPMSHALLTAMYCAIALAAVAFLAGSSTTRKVDVPGVLLPSGGLIRLVPQQAGVLAERRVHEGQRVRAGELMFVLGSAQAAGGADSAEQRVAGLLQRRRDSLLGEVRQLQAQTRQRIAGMQLQGRALREELQRIDEQIGLQRRRITMAEAALSRHVELQQAGFVAAAQVQDRQAELMDQQQRMAELQRNRATTARELSAAQGAAEALPLQGSRDEQGLQRGIAELDQALAENESRTHAELRAPVSGTVTAIAAEPGQAVSAGQALAAIVPADAELEAELYAPSRTIGFVRPGMRVLLRYEAYPFQKFGLAGGTVREVSGTAMRPQDLASDGAAMPPAGAAEPLYRVRVALGRQGVSADGREQALTAGTALSASIVLERRRLAEWLLEPLIGLARRP